MSTWPEGHSKVGMFFHFLFNAHSANLLPKALLPQDDRVGFVEEETLVLQSYPDYSVFHWVVVVSERLGIPHLVITIWEPPTCTLQRTRILRRVLCPAVPRGLDIVSRTLVAAICEGDAPCSVNTARNPLSLTVDTRSTTTLAVLSWFASSTCDRWQRSITVAKIFSIMFRLPLALLS